MACGWRLSRTIGISVSSIAKATSFYPKFEDGRIDYTNERVCFVLNCVVVVGDEVLLTKRGADVIAYPNTINGISGFIDKTDRSIEQQIKDELIEELNAPLDTLVRLSIAEPIIQIDELINRKWHVFVALAEFESKFEPKINWENKSANWHAIESVKGIALMPGFDETFALALRMRNNEG